MAYTLKLHSSPTGPKEIDALTGARRDQFLAAAKGEMGGTKCKVPSDYFKYIAKETDGDVDTQFVELWTVMKEGKDKPLYDLWLFPAAENGAVFETGTAKSAGVEIIQGSFEAPSGTKRAEKLAEELQDSYDDRAVDGDDDDDDDGDDNADEDDDEDEDDDDDEDDEDEDEEKDD